MDISVKVVQEAEDHQPLAGSTVSSLKYPVEGKRHVARIRNTMMTRSPITSHVVLVTATTGLKQDMVATTFTTIR